MYPVPNCPSVLLVVPEQGQSKPGRLSLKTAAVFPSKCLWDFWWRVLALWIISDLTVSILYQGCGLGLVCRQWWKHSGCTRPQRSCSVTAWLWSLGLPTEMESCRSQLMQGSVTVTVSGSGTSLPRLSPICFF